MTSVTMPWSGQPVIAGTRIRWPEDEIGEPFDPETMELPFEEGELP